MAPHIPTLCCLPRFKKPQQICASLGRPSTTRQGAGRWISCANLGAMGSSYDLPKRLAIGGFTMAQCSIWGFP